jgi:hypothetical protein
LNTLLPAELSACPNTGPWVRSREATFKARNQIHGKTPQNKRRRWHRKDKMWKAETIGVLYYKAVSSRKLAYRPHPSQCMSPMLNLPSLFNFPRMLLKGWPNIRWFLVLGSVFSAVLRREAWMTRLSIVVPAWSTLHPLLHQGVNDTILTTLPNVLDKNSSEQMR